MFLSRIAAISILLACSAAPVVAQEKKSADDLSLVSATGVIEKADKDMVVVKPRDAGGRFQKAINLKVTGTTKVSLLAPQKRGEKVIATQRDMNAADLVAGQVVAVIYTDVGKDGLVLLSAVAHSPTAK